MSEQAAEDTNISDENKEQQLEDKNQPDTAEDVARAGGWKPESEWDQDDNQKPKQFVSAELFNERGVWIDRHKAQEKRINEMESTFNTRMDNANKLHQQQMEVQKTDLERKRDDAIDLADREAANGFQKDIDKLNQQSVESVPINNDQTTLNDWNTNNAWIMGNDPKAAYAKQQFAMYQQQGMSNSAAITNMENDINRAFPALNPERDRQPTPEGGTKPGKKRASRKLSMADLSNDELKYYRAMPGAWENEAAYLQAVQDTRGEA